MSIATHIAYAANARGYTVRVLNGTQTLAEYNAGNDPLESTNRLNPDLGGTVPLETLERWAKQTAIEMAQEYGLDNSNVTENNDLLEEDE